MRAPIILSVFALLTASSSALAGPSEYPEEELFEMADVVADVETVSLECNGAPVEHEYAIETYYAATFRTLDVVKGSADEMIEYRVTRTFWKEGELGCSAPEYVLPQGWVGRVYLHQVGDHYEILDPGGAKIDAEASVTSEVPSCVSTSPETHPPTPPEEDEEIVDDDEINPETGMPFSADASGCSVSSTGSSSNAAWLAAALAALAVGLCRRR